MTLLTPLAAENPDDKAVAYMLGTAHLARDDVEAAQRIRPSRGVRESMSELLEQSSAADVEPAEQEP